MHLTHAEAWKKCKPQPHDTGCNQFDLHVIRIVCCHIVLFIIVLHATMPKRSRIMQQAPMVPAPCWFPLTLMALSMMQSTGTRKPRKKISKVKIDVFDNGNKASASGVMSVPGPVPERPSLDLRAEEDPVEEKFKDACHRRLAYFVAFSSLPRSGICCIVCWW